MADDEDSEEPTVTLGEGVDVEGVPLAQVSARLMWGIERSAIENREGETTIRTPDGPQELGEILAEIDSTYFATRHEFENAVRNVIGHGAVPTPNEDEPEQEDVAVEGSEDESGDDETDEAGAGEQTDSDTGSEDGDTGSEESDAGNEEAA